jgi:hypothetical protein
MTRLHPVSYGAGVLLLPDWCSPVPPDNRVVRPARKIRESRRASV